MLLKCSQTCKSVGRAAFHPWEYTPEEFMSDHFDGTCCLAFQMIAGLIFKTSTLIYILFTHNQSNPAGYQGTIVLGFFFKSEWCHSCAMALHLLQKPPEIHHHENQPALGCRMAGRLMFIRVQESASLGIILFSEGTCPFALCFYVVCRTQPLSCPLFHSYEISGDNAELGLPLDLQLQREALNRSRDIRETKG